MPVYLLILAFNAVVSRLNYMRLTECRGQGRKEREAKNNAARNLLDAGYCVSISITIVVTCVSHARS